MNILNIWLAFFHPKIIYIFLLSDQWHHRACWIITVSHLELRIIDGAFSPVFFSVIVWASSASLWIVVQVTRNDDGGRKRFPSLSLSLSFWAFFSSFFPRERKRERETPWCVGTRRAMEWGRCARDRVGDVARRWTKKTDGRDGSAANTFSKQSQQLQSSQSSPVESPLKEWMVVPLLLLPLWSVPCACHHLWLIDATICARIRFVYNTDRNEYVPFG